MGIQPQVTLTEAPSPPLPTVVAAIGMASADGLCYEVDREITPKGTLKLKKPAIATTNIIFRLFNGHFKIDEKQVGSSGMTFEVNYNNRTSSIIFTNSLVDLSSHRLDNVQYVYQITYDDKAYRRVYLTGPDWCALSNNKTLASAQVFLL
jgi:hypothetical protein